MLSQLRDKLVGVLTSRLFILVTAIFLLFSLITVRLFVLQIIRGESYFNNFTLRIEREKTVKSTRGTIYDRNGVVLAQDVLAYSVTIEDNYDSNRRKNMDLNSTIDQLIDIIESNGNEVINDFPIIVNSNGQFQFTYEGTRQLRFLADIYGHNSIEDLKARERGAGASDVVSYLCGREKFGIGEYRDNGDGNFDFMPEAGYSREKLLKMICIRYNLSLNSFQKYISTTVATDVNERTVAEVMEKKDVLQGVDIAEDTVRSYIDDPSFSHVLGYTGKISEEELVELNSGTPDSEDSEHYELNDMVGKSGIEQVMERKLQGKKGRQTIFTSK